MARTWLTVAAAVVMAIPTAAAAAPPATGSDPAAARLVAQMKTSVASLHSLKTVIGSRNVPTGAGSEGPDFTEQLTLAFKAPNLVYLSSPVPMLTAAEAPGGRNCTRAVCDGKTLFWSSPWGQKLYEQMPAPPSVPAVLTRMRGIPIVGELASTVLDLLTLGLPPESQDAGTLRQMTTGGASVERGVPVDVVTAIYTSGTAPVTTDGAQVGGPIITTSVRLSIGRDDHLPRSLVIKDPDDVITVQFETLQPDVAIEPALFAFRRPQNLVTPAAKAFLKSSSHAYSSLRSFSASIDAFGTVPRASSSHMLLAWKRPNYFSAAITADGDTAHEVCDGKSIYLTDQREPGIYRTLPAPATIEEIIQKSEQPQPPLSNLDLLPAPNPLDQLALERTTGIPFIFVMASALSAR